MAAALPLPDDQMKSLYAKMGEGPLTPHAIRESALEFGVAESRVQRAAILLYEAAKPASRATAQPTEITEAAQEFAERVNAIEAKPLHEASTADLHVLAAAYVPR